VNRAVCSIGALFAGATLAWGAAPAAAQRAQITVGTVRSAQTCTVYQASAGRSALVVTPYVIAAASSWRTWLYKDCVQNFATMRTSLEAALAASGKFAVGRGGYVVGLTVSEVSGGGGPAPNAPDMGRGGFSISSSGMMVTLDVTVRDRAGRVVYGGVLTKRLETGSSIKVDGFTADSSASGEAVYGQLQHEIALAAARLVAFHVIPPRITGGDGHEINLNYGAPFLQLGTNLQATSADGRAALRYTVTSATADTAIAEVDGDGDQSRIGPDSIVTIFEADDPAANGRRMRRVELP
jgi:hypothetical protein